MSAIKMMTKIFTRSGSHLYKWLTLRHLADCSSYPENVLDRLKSGAWVSALKDGKGVTLATDEYHERTASKDIQLVLPKRLTDKNMQVTTHYVTYGACSRRNFTEEFFQKIKETFRISKGCISSWLAAQEKKIILFQKLLETEQPFAEKSRSLHQPFTTNLAKEAARYSILGRKKIGDAYKDLGDEMVKTLVKPRFCKTLHDIPTEKIPMKKKILVLFPSSTAKRNPKKSTALKEKENVVNVLAASLVKMSVAGKNSVFR